MSYNVLLVDPPWNYNNKRTGGSMSSGSAQQYDVLTLGQLHRLRLGDVCDRSAVLFLWATTPMLPEALSVMEAWGFKYKTLHTWVKTGRLGMGFWFRVQTEFLLVGVRGSVRPFRLAERNVYSGRPGQHSAKPDIYAALIKLAAEKALDRPRYLEVFARSVRPGWDAWGKAINGLDIFEQLECFTRRPGLEPPGDRSARPKSRPVAV